MTELKFRNDLITMKASDESSSGCGCSEPVKFIPISAPSCCPPSIGKQPQWVNGILSTNSGPVPLISTDLTRKDFIDNIRCRVSAFRNSYIVAPGLYAVGEPDSSSDVFVSANYKLSFDALRKALKNMNAWVLVLDTKGINVWCAAGKGTFGTDEIIRRINLTKLSGIINHKRLILPQLSAPGINAHIVRQKTGFQVKYGPVRADDIRSYVESEYKATREMRTVKFTMIDRLVLTPMEIRPALEYYVIFAAIILIVFGLQPPGIFFRSALSGGLPFLGFGLVSIFSGAFLMPVFLPFIPFRSFAIKGFIVGILSIYAAIQLSGWNGRGSIFLIACAFLFFPFASSYIALQFTGSTTFTGMSGVRKELKISLPIYISALVVSTTLLVVYKLFEWGVI